MFKPISFFLAIQLRQFFMSDFTIS